MKVKKDCIFFDLEHRPAARCTACDKLYCLVHPCSSYKSKDKYEYDQFGYVVEKEQR